MQTERTARTKTLPAAISATILLALFCLPLGAVRIESRVAIERAVYHIDQGNFSLARSYLEIPLIDQRITTTERSRAYYLQGFSFEQQKLYRSAVQEYNKALAFNAANPATLSALGYLTYKGLGVTQDRAEAARLLSASAQLEHPPAMAGLGTLLLEGHGVEQDVELARDWLTRATQANQHDAYLLLGKSFRHPYADPPDPAKAQLYYDKALVLNQPEAWLALGHMHLNGEFDAPDALAAARLFERAGNAGVGAAQTSLAYLYLTGQGVEEDHEQAATLYQRAIDQGDPTAHYGLGYLIEIDPNHNEDEGANDRAQAHYTAAARVNYPPALMSLSRLARNAGDVARGLQWLRRAAEAGAQTAYNRLAWQLATDPDENLRNGIEAVKYAHRARLTDDSSATLDTLAAAYAEAGQFADAIKTQTSALERLQVESAGDQEPNLNDPIIRVEYQTRLASYEAGQPWRQDREAEDDPSANQAP